MNKKYLMNGFAALALIASVSSCTKDVTTMSQGEIDAKAKENAELQLGFSIPDGQTWNMASQVEANVTVNGDYGANYTVSIYEENPFQNNNHATVLGKADVVSGGTATINITCPNASTMLFAAIKDEKGYTYVKPVTVENGKIETVFGNAASASRSMRTVTNSSVNIPTGSSRATIEAQAAGILAKSVELNETNNNDDSPGSYYYGSADNNYMTPNPNYVINYLISGTYTGLVNKLGAAGREWTGEWTEEWGNKVPAYNIVPRTVYVKGKWTIPSEEGKNYQVCGNGWNSNGTPSNQVDGIIVVGEKGELVVNGTLNMANLARLIVLPGGRVTGTGSINICNGSATGQESYNFGTISVKKLNENFGNFFNYGTITSEELIGGAGTSCFVNHGRIDITTAYGNSGSPANLQIKNNCWFEASGEVAAKVIENAANAYLTCASMKTSCGYGNDNVASYIAADNNSLLHVEGMWRNNNTTVIGPTSGGNAFIEIGTIKQWDYTNGTTGMIQNNIYFSYESVERSDNNSDTEYCVNYNVNKGGNGNVTFIQKKCANVAPIEESDCAPGYIPDPPTPIYETLKVYTYAFEDQTVGTDYDMNDVVLKVNYKVKSTGTGDNAGKVEYDKTKLAVKLVAAGATYNIKVKIGRNYIFGGEEIHNVLKVNGVAVGAGVMVNTGNGKAVTATPATDEIDVPTGWNGDFTTLPVSIEVTSTNTTYSYPNTDEYPHAIMVPTDWAWPLERINVKEAYPGTSDATKVTVSGVEYPVNSFAAWGGTPAANRTSEMEDWYNNPLSGKTMTNASATNN